MLQHQLLQLKNVPHVAGSVVPAGSRPLAGSQSRTGRGVVASQVLPTHLHTHTSQVKKRQEKSKPVGVNLMTSLVRYQAAQILTDQKRSLYRGSSPWSPTKVAFVSAQ